MAYVRCIGYAIANRKHCRRTVSIAQPALRGLNRVVFKTMHGPCRSR